MVRLKDTAIGLIGAGSMGTAIVQALVARGMVNSGQVSVFDQDAEKAARLSGRWSFKCMDAAGAVFSSSRVILLAIKPQDLEAFSAQARSFAGPSHIVISVLAGVTAGRIRDSLGGGVRVVRAMPNLGAMAEESMTALASPDEQALALAEEIFMACGKTAVISETLFDLVTAVSGSGPAYFFLLMESLERIGIRKGLPPETARLLAVQTAIGAAQVARESAGSIRELRDRVTSKRGTTEAALKIFSERGFEPLIDAAVEAAERRGRELSGEKES